MKKFLFVYFFLLVTLYPLPSTLSLPSTMNPDDTIWNRILREQSKLSTAKGLILMEQKKYFEALKEFSDALMKNPYDPYAHLAYGCGLYWVGEVDKALEKFKAALELDEKNALAFQLIGIVHAYNGEPGMALANFLKANEYSPQRGDIKMNLGSVYHSMGNYGQAMDYLRQAVAIEPQNPLFHFQLGLLYSRLERNEEAKQSFQNALSLFADYEDAMLELAVLEEKDGNVSEALKLYRKALKIKPMDKVVRFRLASSLLRQAKTSEAQEVLNEAFALSKINNKGGISMSIAYAGNLPAENTLFSQDVSSSPFLNSLSKISPEDEIKIKIELIQIPKLQVTTPSEQVPKSPSELRPTGRQERSGAGVSKEPGLEKSGLLNKSLEKTLNYANFKYLKREYIIPSEEDFHARMKKISDISKQIDKLLQEVSVHGEIKMSVKVETEKKIKSYAKQQPNADKKVLYNPREVGNDMGLWVLGNNWIELVEEGISELREWISGQNTKTAGLEYIILGLGNLILGNPDSAIDDFIKVKDDKLQDLSNLGISVAWVEKGSENKSLYFCEQALKSNPKNAVALRNKKWLETPNKDWR